MNAATEQTGGAPPPAWEREEMGSEDDPGLVLGAKPLNAVALAEVLPPICWTCKDLQLGPGRPNMLIGYSGSAKTFFALSLAVSIASDRLILGQFRVRMGARVLFLSKDSGRRACIGRVQRLARGLGVDLAELADRLVVVPHPKVPLTDPNAVDAYRSAVTGFGLCVIDAMRGFLPGVDENDARVREYLDRLTEISDATGCAFLVLHHEGKGGTLIGGKGGRAARPDDEAPRGSTGIIDASGCMIRIVREEQQGRTAYAVRIAKDAEERPGPRNDPFYFQIEDVPDDDGRDPWWGVRLVYRTAEQINGPPAKPGDKFTGIKAKVLAHIQEQTRAGRAVAGKGALAAALELGDRTVGPAVDVLLAERAIHDLPEKSGHGKPKPRLWAGPPPAPCDTPEIGSVSAEEGE